MPVASSKPEKSPLPKPHGWFSAGLAPMMRTTSAFLMSLQWLVIAPRPKLAARLATVGPCCNRKRHSSFGGATTLGKVRAMIARSVHTDRSRMYWRSKSSFLWQSWTLRA